MDQQVEVSEILANMREQLGLLMQENAILKATIKKLQEEKTAKP